MSVEAMQSIEMDEENSASQTVCACYSFFSWSGSVSYTHLRAHET